MQSDPCEASGPNLEFGSPILLEAGLSAEPLGRRGDPALAGALVAAAASNVYSPGTLAVIAWRLATARAEKLTAPSLGNVVRVDDEADDYTAPPIDRNWSRAARVIYDLDRRQVLDVLCTELDWILADGLFQGLAIREERQTGHLDSDVDLESRIARK
jgi:hypothetical protein